MPTSAVSGIKAMSPPCGPIAWILLVSLALSPYGAAVADNRPLIEAPVPAVDSPHDRFSSAIETLARRVDSFFGDERAFEEENDTTLQVTLDTTANDNGDLEFDSALRAKLALPAIEKRLKLVIESDQGRDTGGTANNDPVDALEKPSDYIIGLERGYAGGLWQFQPSVGLRMDLPPDPYVRFRTIRYADLQNWLARVSGTATWFSQDGAKLDANLDFDRQLDEQLLIRSASSASWEEENSLAGATQIFTLFQHLSANTGMAYDLGASVDNDPDWNVDNTFVRLRYRRQLYKTWAYLELQPMLAWPEDNNYREELSLLLRLEINFGRGYH